ncbi:hypothetical protein ACO2Q0_05345 [Phenylobacterium sp. VNQ135]|uniref:hypothetical protein n=1 Tax=Phenylobacterium sp. VNQ135 TaxID=3400922 RepID=UPI003C0A5D93
MLKKVLWVALACAVLLAALAISRGVRFTSEPVKTEPVATAPAAEEAAEPAAAQAPEPQPTAPPQPTPEELQVQEDAAAVGLTTVEPEAEPAPETPAAKTPPQ